MLEVEELHAYYGKSHVLHGVSFSVQPGEVVALLGRNGVGRSTSIKAIMGLVAARGSVRFRNQELLGLKAHEIARRGLGYVPEDCAIFPDLKAVAQVSEFLSEMKKRAISVLLVEQKLTISLQISQRLYVMGHGRVVFHGTPDELRENQSVRKEWLEV